ncbi:hypothetical protein [Mycobacterium marinum]|uniref:hypothetical protein n=1 Tax=Mycobacterium marinum TaxID=1781 RepID=UPI002359620F|nr:hypothetical protein [Mycobacterium marinum]MDC8970840.1 hypothetical protein [Mycobacterium marinum]
MTNGIPSARKKLDRARIHLQSLHDAVEAFREDHPYDFETTSPGNEPGRPDFRVKVIVTQAAPVPDTWALITGDILTNLRATLDHAVFPHIRALKPDLARKYIQYPIEDRKNQWEPYNRWFTQPVKAVVGASQPYRNDQPELHQLRVLRELVNMDKHRDLVIGNYSVDDVHMESDFFKVVSTVLFLEEMVPGAVVAKAHLRLTEPIHGQQLKNFGGWVEYREKIKIPGCKDLWPLLGVADALVKFVGTLIDDLEQAGC